MLELLIEIFTTPAGISVIVGTTLIELFWLSCIVICKDRKTTKSCLWLMKITLLAPMFWLAMVLIIGLAPMYR